MHAACALSLGLPLVVRSPGVDRKWTRAVDVRRKECGSIQPVCRGSAEWQKRLEGFGFAVKRLQRAPSLRKVQIEDDSEAFRGRDEDSGALETSTVQSSTETEPPQGGRDLSWLPVLPHALTAALSNFMFGYHIGIINGPLPSMAKELYFEGNTLLQGLVVSIFLAGAFLGSVGGGVLSDAIGRRRTFQFCAIPLVLGAILSATADSVEILILGRLIVGISIGVHTPLAPLYISEISPSKYRGALGSLCQLEGCTGIITALLLGIPSDANPHWWRTLFWLATIPAFLLIGAMQFCVESPRWLGSVSRWDEASKTFEKLWGKDQVQSAMEDLRKTSAGTEEEASWGELLSRRYFRVAAIGGALYALQQFAGINGILYFSSSNFHDAGITNNIAASALIGVANIAGALVALALMDSQGRKKMLMGSYSGMALSIAIMVAALTVPLDPSISHLLTVGGTFLYCFTFALGAGPVTALIIAEMCGTRIRAKAMAVSLCVHWVCNFGIGLLFLEVVQLFGLPLVYTSFGVVSILSVLFASNFLIETRGRSLEEIELLVSPKEA